MEERESPLSKIKGNEYSNLLDKIKNRKVGNDVAWYETQHLFTMILDGYPEKYRSLDVIIREIFNARRDAYRGEIGSKEASLAVQSLVKTLCGARRDLIDEPLVCIRDLFDIPSSRRPRSF